MTRQVKAALVKLLGKGAVRPVLVDDEPDMDTLLERATTEPDHARGKRVGVAVKLSKLELTTLADQRKGHVMDWRLLGPHSENEAQEEAELLRAEGRAQDVIDPEILMPWVEPHEPERPRTKLSLSDVPMRELTAMAVAAEVDSDDIMNTKKEEPADALKTMVGLILRADKAKACPTRPASTSLL
jgi:hypothetical protein